MSGMKSRQKDREWRRSERGEREDVRGRKWE